MTDDATITKTLTEIQVDIAALRGEVSTLAAELRASVGTQVRDLDALGHKVRALEARVDVLEDASAVSRGWVAGIAASSSLLGALAAVAAKILMG